MYIRAIPIYGNGWTDGLATVDEPEPFDVELATDDNSDFAGQIVSLGHAFYGHGFQASRRHVEHDDCYNCQILLSNGIILQGYCSFEKV